MFPAVIKKLITIGLILLVCLSCIHFHAFEPAAHPDCLACSVGMFTYLETALLVVLFIQLFIKKILPATQKVFLGVYHYFQRFRAPPLQNF